MTQKKRKKARIITEVIIASFLAIGLLIGAWQAYRLYIGNISSYDAAEHDYYIYPGTTIDSLLCQVERDYHIASPFSLRLHAKLMHWPADGQRFVRTGHYVLPSHMPDIAFIRKFRNGWQDPVTLSFHNIRTQAQLSSRLADQLMLDSADIASRLADPDYMQRFGLTVPTAVCLFLPDSYSILWDVSPDQLFQRMKKEYDRFWNDERLQKAHQLGFEPAQIATIASIVEEETNKDCDKPVIAGLYMNRLRLNMPLQACPTVKFALQDFSLRRILNKHLEVESPYNTYKHAGLPPGPIRIPTAKTLDYALNPTPSNYLFMCASTAFDGTHHFSSTYAQHAAYAREYQAALNRRGIK